MKINSAHIKNFRGIEDLTLDFTDELGRVQNVTAITGHAASGKTSALAAIYMAANHVQNRGEYAIRDGASRAEVILAVDADEEIKWYSEQNLRLDYIRRVDMFHLYIEFWKNTNLIKESYQSIFKSELRDDVKSREQMSSSQQKVASLLAFDVMNRDSVLLVDDIGDGLDEFVERGVMRELFLNSKQNNQYIISIRRGSVFYSNLFHIININTDADSEIPEWMKVE